MKEEKLQKDEIYLFYDGDGYPLGCGIWKETYIDEIPKTCGGNAIDPVDVFDWWLIKRKNK